MKIVVIGGSGLIGSKVVAMLHEKNHKVLAASPKSGVNTLTGAGLAEALDGADVVVDLANTPDFDDDAALSFFRSSGGNLLGTAARAGVRRHVALSVVGAERLQTSGYFRAKLLQEELIRQSGIPYTILRSTQFFEFIDAIAQAATTGSVVRLSPAHIQPIAADDVAGFIVQIALAEPRNGTVELAGPERTSLDELVRRYFDATEDSRSVMTDVHATYFGTELNDRSLTPGNNPLIGSIYFADWINHSRAQQQASPSA